MTKDELYEKLTELENKYQDKTIETPEGTLHIYYIFKAGQMGWTKYFDRYHNTSKNFEEAKEHILRTFGYLGRDSQLIAFKKGYFKTESDTNVFEA